ncbi:DegQ family serine endoprotease [Pseudoxanthomonas sp.]|uniref:DegQ family serine endoprotease n=1 Tax=Pseudoxanthomonas sp. TaxID=1871049 RepID=UPI002FE03989
MTLHARHSLLALLILTTPLAACAQQAETPAPVAAPAVAQSAAPQLVTGLPDFTQLVEQVGPGVVNVEATVGSRRSAQAGEEADIPEIFRRMLPPGFQMPGPGQQGPQRRGTSMGSGFIISADGYVLTNHHVVDGADEVKVTLPDRRELVAKVVGSDQQYDVALLKVEAKGLPTVRIGNSATLKPGQWVVAIGSPLGLDHSVTAGIVSAVGRTNPYTAEQRYVPFVQTDVAINQGNSGGPLLNTSGEVVGINSQIFSVSGGYMGISFAIPIDLAMAAVEQLKTTGRVSRGQLGVQVGALTADVVKGFNLPDNRGALISEVLPGSPAAKAGLDPGDVIRSVNGRAINDSSDLPPIIGAMAPGSKVTLSLLRDGKIKDITVILVELDEGSVATDSLPTPSDRQAPPAGRNTLGIQSQNLDAGSRKQLGVESGGVLITRVEGAAAREAGLVPGMVVLQVGRAKVDSPAALDRELAATKAGDTVMLLVRQRGVTRFLAVTVEKS